MHSAVSQRCFWIMCSWPDLPVFTRLCRLATVPRSSLGAAVESYFCLWVQLLLENTPAVAVHRLQKPPCPPARRAFSPVPVLKEKHLWLWCITHRALHPPTPRPLTHRQRLAVVFNFMMRREKNSRQNTSSRGGTTEHGNSCGPAVSQVQGISLCAWSQDCLHLYELLQLCPSPGSHFIYTLIGLRCN